ncbi:hypothetical protein B4098_0500 [Heyndrickxia coagulans]|uniref:Uncharacterized protein n=1 Tax=Heyndrickxia coagulans TaxID=1398 RepID=A0A150K6I2_HEYCO|nr:hypothetical protein B4098_0500 [Heyndrickxia coagulans]
MHPQPEKYIIRDFDFLHALLLDFPTFITVFNVINGWHFHSDTTSGKCA